MSDLNSNPSNAQFEKAGASDESLQRAHASLIRSHAEFNEKSSKLPLFLLGLMSVLIFAASVYMVRHRGGFDPISYDAKFDPRMAVAASAKPTVNPVAEGEKLFATCSACHGPTGKGTPGVFPPLAGSEWATGSEERVIRILLSGLSGPLKVEGATYGAAQMPAFGPGGYGWSDEKISYVLTYVRQAFGNKAGEISPEKVAEIRGKIGQRKAWTEEELLAIP
ncbi:MAG TPA: cytochrome c [Opitutaceae bacterium]|nr:cytochrome c [Opitutaceae bacterium]